MLTAKQAGAALGLSARKVYDLAKAGAIPSFRFGKAIRFDPADVETYRRAMTAPLVRGREARTLERMRIAAQKAGDPCPFTLPPEILAMAEERIRNLRRAPWADPVAIAAIYAEARRLTTETGVQHHIDHEIPLLGEFVSGLHVETNLRVLPARENILKSNCFKA